MPVHSHLLRSMVVGNVATEQVDKSIDSTQLVEVLLLKYKRHTCSQKQKRFTKTGTFVAFKHPIENY